jgi:hypothetical protein
MPDAVEQCLKDPKTNDIAREVITEFIDNTLQGKSVGEYNEIEVNSWRGKVEQSKQYLIEIKSKQWGI